MIWFGIIIVVVFGLFHWHSKIKFVKQRESNRKLSAEVIEYRKEKSPMRNDYTRIPYPYVRIIDEEVSSELIKLKYSNSFKNPFQISDIVEVFWHEGTLFYWNAYDEGIMKYFPERWNFWLNKNKEGRDTY